MTAPTTPGAPLLAEGRWLWRRLYVFATSGAFWLMLDRLIAASPAGEVPPGTSAQLDRLFRLVQSQPDFAPAGFARELAAFAALLGP